MVFTLCTDYHVSFSFWKVCYCHWLNYLIVAHFSKHFPWLTFKHHWIYNKTPKITIIENIKHKDQEEWQIRWNNTSNGLLSKTFFQSIKERLKIKLPLIPDFTAIVIGHGKTKAYLHWFHIIDNPTCTCKKAQQTVNHLIYECPDIGQQRWIIQNGDQWPVTNQQLISRHLRNFCEFVKSMNL